MSKLRNSLYLARLVLVMFVLSVGVAIASPILKPEATVLICTSSGLMKLVALDEDTDPPVNDHKLDCPLCVCVSAPPPVASTSLSEPFPLSFAMPFITATHISFTSSPPLPSRGPPPLTL
jgi:hypothetical protein